MSDCVGEGVNVLEPAVKLRQGGWVERVLCVAALHAGILDVIAFVAVRGNVCLFNRDTQLNSGTREDTWALLNRGLPHCN